MNGDRNAVSAAAGRKYGAFMSYSRGDAAAASALQGALHSFNRPWYALRSVRIFRDESDAQIGSDLRKIIFDALDESEWLILLLSRHSVRSPWVAHEVEYWLKKRGLGTILVVMVDPALTWNEAAADFRVDVERSELAGLFDTEPSYVDLHWIATAAKPRSDARLLDGVAELTEKITGQEKAVLIGEDRRKQRWRLMLAGVATLMLLALSVAASIFGIGQRLAVLEREAEQRLAESLAVKAEAETRQATKAQHAAEVSLANEKKARIEAERQTRLATGNRLATQASLAVRREPAVSVLLAVEAARRSGWSGGERLASVEQALHNALGASGGTPLPRIETEHGIASDRTRTVAVMLGQDRAVRLYDLKTKAPAAGVRELGKLRYAPRDIAMSGDGSTVLALSVANDKADTTERVVWRLSADGRISRIDLPQTQRGWSAGLSDDGRWAITGTQDGTVRVDDLNDRSAPPVQWRAHDDYVLTIHAGTMPWLVTTSSTEVRCTNVYAIGSGAEDPLANVVDRSLAFSANERYVAVDTGTGVAIYELTKDGCRRTAELHEPDVRSPKVVAIDNSGSQVATAGATDVLDITDVTTRKITSLMCPAARYGEFSSDGTHLAAASEPPEEHAVHVWSLTAANVARSRVVLHNDENDWLQEPPWFSGDGRWLVTNAMGRARLWDSAVGYFSSSAVTLASDDSDNYTVRAPNAARLGVIHAGQAVETFDLDAPSIGPLTRFGMLPGDRLVAVSNDLEHWLASSDDSETLLDRHGNPVARIAGGKRPQLDAARFNKAGTLLAIMREDGSGAIVDVEHPRVSTPIPKSNRGLGWSPIAFSDDGRWLFAGQWLVRVDRRPMRMLQLQPPEDKKAEREFRCAAFTRDGRTLVTGSGEWTQFWELRDDRPKPTNIHVNTDNVRTIAVDPNGRRVVTGSYDGSVHVFDLRNVASPRVLRAARHFVTWSAFAEGGRWLATGSVDGRAYLWDTDADPSTIQPVTYGQSVFVTAVLLNRSGDRLMAGYAVDGSHQSVIVFNRNLRDLERIAAQTLRRNFTQREWQQYFPAEPYRKTFSDLPSE
jgi:WD40 repeat protein